MTLPLHQPCLSSLYRYVLNIKGLKHRTIWTDMCDIEPMCKRIGAKPTRVEMDGVTPKFTVPVLYDPSTQTVLSESFVIVDYLDKAYPDTRPIFRPDTRGLCEAFRQGVDDNVIFKAYPLILSLTYRFVDERSLEDYKRTRIVLVSTLLKATVPTSVEEIDGMWKIVEAGLKLIAGWYDAGSNSGSNTDSVFMDGGEEFGAPDIIMASRLIALKTILGENSERWARIRDIDGGRWGRLLSKFEKYNTII